MTEAIRLCPHCAHDRYHLVEVDDRAADAFTFACDECGARGPMDTDADIAAMKWNMR